MKKILISGAGVIGSTFGGLIARSGHQSIESGFKGEFRFPEKSGIGIKPLKLHVFLWLPFWVLNLVMKLVFNTKWAETVISNHALVAREEMEVIANEFVTLASSPGFELMELIG